METAAQALQTGGSWLTQQAAAIVLCRTLQQMCPQLPAVLCTPLCPCPTACRAGVQPGHHGPADAGAAAGADHRDAVRGGGRAAGVVCSHVAARCWAELLAC